MPIRIKQCHYCNIEFNAKRIDAMYCSNSCKMMAYRRDHELNKYDNRKPIHLDIDMVSYEIIRENAEEKDQDIETYIIDMCKRGEKDAYTIQLTKDIYHMIETHLLKKYPDKKLKDAFGSWFIDMYSTEKFGEALKDLKKRNS